MIMYKLEHNKDKSPTFASCHAPARTLGPDTPKAVWATCHDPWSLQGGEGLWGRAKESDLHGKGLPGLPLQHQPGSGYLAPVPLHFFPVLFPKETSLKTRN